MKGSRRQPSKSPAWGSISWSTFLSRAHSVSDWRSDAMSLFKTAHFLLPHIEKELEPAVKFKPKPIKTRMVYLMLVGMAFENLGKALLIQMKSPIAKNGTFMHKSHKLIDIFNDANIKVSKEENFLLERLEQYIIWAGRYPIPKKYEELLPRESSIDGNSFNLGYDAVKDPALIMSLYKRLLRELAFRMKKNS